ncbi:aminotransferase class I/II-fold pyridoxal phosphate-dependent enzyme [Flavobacterium sp. J49]|uniref:methionine aminotransferase n=1 Tax=Flavobacterium sp. J49 TaxID=2718534 RepID=UPI001592BD62|nr:methionine aminotransferase [Flavobacterium sp. J49]MBF6642443.1 aminotransferase class I/II-fold pyridoxal phosphate-dependent enzyme [Flavobacterium sp. J49]NIC03689.1 aminotransferase class I/II-fold pyridoxal phosphate-dependent enzyme [Flavobacterium sp. J49]
MSKLPHIGTSIFTIMSQMATEYQAINLSQGFPNFPVDKRLTAILAKHAKENVHQYTPMSGLPSLLEKIALLTQQSYGRNVSPKEEILITAGATQGIFASIQALVQAHEEVIILDPSYDCYEAPILLSNAKPIRVSLNDDFTPNWEVIFTAVNEKTKLIIINNPHNPTGKMWTENDFVQLEKLVDAYPNLLVLSDEVYEYITFEKPHISVHHRPKLWHRSISVSSFGKSFHITGWKIGYVIAPEPIMREIKKVHQFLVFSVSSIAQHALNDYIDWVDVKALGAFYQQKRDFFSNLMKATKLDLLPCEGTYFQVASYANISEEKDLDFTKRLVTELGVATIPISIFYANGNDNKCIRFCFAKDDETLLKAAERLMKL